MRYRLTKRRAHVGLLTLAIAFAPAFASRAIAQTQCLAISGCRTTLRFSASSGGTPIGT